MRVVLAAVDPPVVDITISQAIDWWTIIGTFLATFLGVLIAAALAFRQYRRTRQHDAVQALIEQLPGLESAVTAAVLCDAMNQDELAPERLDAAQELIASESAKLVATMTPLARLWLIPESARVALGEIVIVLGAVGLGLSGFARPSSLAPGTKALGDRLDTIVPLLADWVRTDGRWFGIPSKLNIPEWEAALPGWQPSCQMRGP